SYHNVKNKTEDKLVVMIQKFYLFEASKNENNVNENYEDKNNKELDDNLAIPNHYVVVLINNIVNLHHQVFN
ncbi:10237_t:CDS:1, partial [Dentiscutata heterogama]